MPVNPLAIDMLTRQAQGFAPSMQPPAVAGMVPGGFGAPAQNVPTTTVPAPAPAGGQGAFDALVGQSVGKSINTPAAPATPTITPGSYGSLAEVPEVKREDYESFRGPGLWGQILGGITGQKSVNPETGEMITGSGRMTMNDEGTARYLEAKMKRLDAIARLAGLSDAQRAAMDQRIRYALAGSEDTYEIPDGNGTKSVGRADYIDYLVDTQEADLASQAIDVATGVTPTGTEATPAGQWTPEQMMAAQTLAGNFLKPYADQMAANGQMQAAALNEMAKGMPPEMANLVRSQAATRAAGDARLSQAYMQQAMMIPAMAAYQQAGAMQGEIDNLTRQAMYAQAQQGGAATLTPDALTAAGLIPPGS